MTLWKSSELFQKIMMTRIWKSNKAYPEKEGDGGHAQTELPHSFLESSVGSCVVFTIVTAYLQQEDEIIEEAEYDG